MTYKVSIGFDTPEDMEPLDPQCKSVPGIQSAERVYVAGNAYPKGEQYSNLVFTVADESEKNNLDAQFGVSETVLFNEVTIQILNNDDTWGIYNANVEFPEVGVNARRNQFGWELTYIVHIVEALD